MKKTGTFEIETSFNVTNRGIIAVGQPVEGIPKLGAYISLDIFGNEEFIKIVGIERGNPDENGIVRLGLLLAIEDLNHIKYIADNKINEQVASIFEKD